MALNSVYKKYFQKSKVFLYPLLGIKRGVSVIPVETYFCWDGYYNSEDMKLICVYDIRTDDEYVLFEKNILLKHNRLCDYIKVHSQAILTFDFSDMENDWFHLINGRYSKISLELKQKILGFFDKFRNSRNITNFDQHIEYGFISAAVSRSPKTGNSGGNAGVRVSATGTGQADG